jgi:hypothetical protein
MEFLQLWFYPDDKGRKRSRILFYSIYQLIKDINYRVLNVHDDVSSYGSEIKLFYFIYFIYLSRMVVHIYYISAAGNSISSQLGSSYQGNRYVWKRQAVRPIHHVQNHTLPGHSPPAARRAAMLGQPSRLQPFCLNWGEWGLREYIRKWSFLGWFFWVRRISTRYFCPTPWLP